MPRRIALLAVPVVVGLLHAPHGHAQTPEPGAAFEVASIKLNTSCANGGRVPSDLTPGRFNLSCVGVRNLIRAAYSGFVNGGIAARRIQVLRGPGWIDTELYDISAKAPGNAPFDQMAGPMLRALLEDRFQVKAHSEPREVPVYTLTVAKGGLKLQASKPGTCTPVDMNNLPRNTIRPGDPVPKYCGFGTMRGKDGLFTADWYGVTMAEFAGRMLENDVDRPIIDKTGLTGRFDLHLEFTRDNALSGPVTLNGAPSPGLPSSPADTATGASIFTALQQQLGLKLSPGKGPVDVLVIDHVEKPSAN
jgi:uncharacterized protein (TIGR03435 family)